jgi:outer membrane protein assembly factor BamB
MSFVRASGLLPRSYSWLLMLMPALPVASQAYFASVVSAEDGDAGSQTSGKSSASDGQQPKIDPLDWPYWRGPEKNGISRETGLIDHWDKKGDNVIWRKTELGSRSTPIVMRGKIYTICRHEPGTPREQEKIVCADAKTGDVLWENRFNVYLSDVPKERLGWSCCVGDPTTGRIYAMGVCDYFQCLDGDTGETVWSHSLNEEYGFLNTYGGRTNMPVVFEDLVIINAVVIGWGDMAVPAHRYVAFDKATGVPRWFNGTRLRPSDTTYSSPMLTVLGGQAAMVFGSGDGAVWAFQPRTGRPIWKYQLSVRGLNVSPLVVGDTVYMSHSEENPNETKMGAFAAINGVANSDPSAKDIDITKTGTKWSKREIMVGKTAPICVDGRLYALDDANLLYIFDAESGEPIGRKQRLTGTITRASPIYADGKIYACTTSAWHVLKPTETGVKITHRLRFGQGEEIHGSPIVSHGRIYLPTTDALYCLGDADANTGADECPQPPAEDEMGDDTMPDHLQVFPVESLIAPGENVKFSARLFNKRGQLLGDAEEVSYEVDTGGEISDQGVFTANDQHEQAGCIVTAKVGELTGTARVRVVPPLPWKYDFANRKIPVTWVGARYRHIPLDFDLLQALKGRDERAAELYIYLTSTFVNSGQAKASYNDRTPRRTWTDFLRYLGLLDDDSLRTVEGAKKALDPAFDTLKDMGVVENWKWSSKEGDVGLDVVGGTPEKQGLPVMAKITTIPKGTRSQCIMGPPELHDYTIQADVRGAIRDGKQPDIGLIAQRYTLDLMGVKQQLQVRSWTSELGRFSKTVPFKWNYDTWYTIKFQASVEEGKAVLKGKVWPQGEAEPDEWSIEAVDDMPNVIGSPGLFGNATDAEIFVNNIIVTKNE